MKNNPERRCVLLTGATGFLGAQIALRLLKENDLTIVALVRAEDQAAAVRRLERAWWDNPELAAALRENFRVEVIQGDVSLHLLGLDTAAYSHLVKRVTHIIHSAADLRVNVPIDALRKTNVEGTATMLAFAKDVNSDHVLERYSHISTAYVAGRRKGAIAEADLSGESGFSNAYEMSKYEGEVLVQAAKKELPISVFRPGMIVGSADSGEIRTFNTFYYPLRLYLSGKMPIIPADPAMPVNIIPVDVAADAIVRLTFNPEAEGLNFHLTAPAASLPRLSELVKFVREWASEHLGIRLPLPVFLSLPLQPKAYLPEQDHINHSDSTTRARKRSLWPEFKSLRTVLPYFNEHKQFQRENVDRLLGAYTLNWREFMPRLLAYAANQGFMHRSERTVHEQILTRLNSKSRPVKYFDIVEGKMTPHSANEVRQEILAAAASLTALGVKPGERIAIVGLNSTRYLALNTAIGLVGAVSVPLYYTSPPGEIDHILKASGAKLLLIGAPKIMERLEEIHANLPVVSFCRGELLAKPSREVISWGDFLKLGDGITVHLQAPIGFGDLASLHYTSGTTGQPKGVSFQHQHLRWMGQTMASLLPWKARTNAAKYLSFLPMSHVVEGILATYSPYYLPAAVDIYFLDELKEIKQVLPRVRPMIFFSVPRIYEKIWEALEQNPVGKRYLSLKSGLGKRILGGVLRRQTLRKAGLERCAQLITGSAPCGEQLLMNFRGLGIEVHNAYGLTEAPLVTLNRKEANRLGTVGAPLPETEIRIAEDGEVLIRGPQVMAGYYDDQGSGKTDQPFRDGWLLSGDLGSLTPEGSLVLNGRKKELFKTSYGKYVQPAKIEALLREIHGAAEAMLIGEQRPFCAALIWLNDIRLDVDGMRKIDEQIAHINHNLSHPEQIKRWAILENDLSIESGDLTANLKLKRQVIACRLEKTIQGIYEGSSLIQGVVHIGEAGQD